MAEVLFQKTLERFARGHTETRARLEYIDVYYGEIRQVLEMEERVMGVKNIGVLFLARPPSRCRSRRERMSWYVIYTFNSGVIILCL